MTKVQVPYNWIARGYQEPLLNYLSAGMGLGGQRAVCVWHRRAGKDLTSINWSIYASCERPGNYYHFLPKTNQGRKVIWDGKDRDGRPFLDYWPPELVRGDMNATEMKLHTNTGSLWQVLGSDNFDNVMGTNPVGIIFSEFSLQNPQAWDFFRPILMENKGWAVFLFTPRGRNHAHRLYLQAKEIDSWFCELLTVTDTGVITPLDIQAERAAGMSEEMIEQEFYCSFEAAAPGAYFASELRRAREEGRITKVPFQSGVGVDTWWDLGVDDSTSIWFTQDVGRAIHVIGYYENRGEGLEFYARILEEKINQWRGVYGIHTAPHDITVRELGTGKTRLKTAGTLGLKFKVAPRPARKEDGHQAIRNIFPVCYFDEKECQQGIDGLASYRSEYVDKNQVYRAEPIHDWASHPADGFQTLALAHRFKEMVKPRMTGRIIPSYVEGEQSTGWMVS